MTNEDYAKRRTSHPPKPLRDAKTSTSSERSNDSTNSPEENSDADSRPGKRRLSVADADDVASKRLCEDSEFRKNQYRSNIPHNLIRLMYQLDLSVLCLFRKSTRERKYRSLSLAFEDSEIDKFNNIVLRHEGKSIHVRVENVDKYYTDNDINYAALFTREKEKRGFFINDYFDGFAKYLISGSGSSSDNVEYLILYSNSGLDITGEKKLRRGRSRSFYPFEFYSVNTKECRILKDFLFTNDNALGRDFYQFSRDDTTREELLKRLEFSPATLKAMREKKLPQEFENRAKKAFLDKLIFAANQPSREELSGIVRSEVKRDREVRDDYVTLRDRILSGLAASGERKRFGNSVFRIIYEFDLLTLFLHDMFSRKNMSSINFEGNSRDIAIDYRDRITRLKAHNADMDIGWTQLFPSRQREEENMFSINKHFSLFVEGPRNDTRYFIMYTNADLNLTGEKRLKRGKPKDFYPLKFDSVDIKKKRYKVLRDCSCINENGLYKLSPEETTREKLLGLLKLPPLLLGEKEEGRLSDRDEKEIKERFLDRLILAVNQRGGQELNSAVRNQTSEPNAPYNQEELREVALRWLESHEFGHITKEVMGELLEDVKNERFSYRKILNTDINGEINFAKSVVGRIGTPSFHRFLNFLIKGEGRKYLEVLKRRKIDLANMSSILNRAGNNAVKAFKGLYDLWFDEEGNETQYLKTLEKGGINLASMSGILNGAGNNAVKAFEELYDLWFDEKGNKTRRLKTLEKNGINLTNMSSILNGAGINAPASFEGLYDLWFDARGNKSRYLKTLENEGTNLASMSGILNGAGSNAARAFKGLYDLWFDREGNKTRYLKTLEKEGMNLANMSSILNGAGIKASTAFRELYDLWFDAEGNKTQCLKTLEAEGVDLASMSSILSRSAANATKAFKGLYNLWFDAQGNESRYLKTLKKEGISLASMSGILHGAAANAVKAFEELYTTFFDEQGKRKQHLKHFIDEKDERRSFMLNNLSSILNGAGANPRDAFEKLHSVCFNERGKRRKLLDDFFEADFKASHISCMLCGAGVRASSALEILHSVCFDDEGKRTKLLEDFYEIGFTPGDLCNILSGAVGSFEKFHRFCFVEETKKYLNHFLNERGGFTLSGLCSILHGARANLCSALEDFHNVCFDETGNRTELLDDFYKAGFTPNDLSHVLSMAANNAASVLRNFHQSCFNEREFLDHFLVEKTLFTPKDLSKILHGVGTNACTTFEKLHDLCFDKAGKKTKYLNNLIRNDRDMMIDILYEKVRKISPSA